MTSVTFFPVVTEDQLMDTLSRAAWFLSSCPIDTIYILISSSELQNIPWHVAPGMDKHIERNFTKLRNMVQFVIPESAEDIEGCMNNSSFLLYWKEGIRPDYVTEDMLSNWEINKEVFHVDPVSNRQEGGAYIHAGFRLLDNKHEMVEENEIKFQQLCKRLGKYQRSCLMATGPSISEYKKHDFNDSLAIVCNSVILDEDLMDSVQPEILVFADPIFHYGPSQYAAEFRSKLLESTRKHRYTICMPIKYYALFIAIMPELKDRVIAIPFMVKDEFNFDLSKEFCLKATANILTFVMVPLAATFANEIGFLGCDGRPLKDDNYFWSHNPKTQINDKMKNIREVHPGFFSIDYNDYYLEHCNLLEQQVIDGESKGKKFISLAFSHIPILQKRLGRGSRIGSTIKADSGINIILVEPDGLDVNSDFFSSNINLMSALEERGHKVDVLCNNNTSSDIVREHQNYHARLSQQSSEVAQSSISINQEIFSEELSSALRELVRGNKTTLLYVNAASLEHARILAHLTRANPNIFIHVNLYYQSPHGHHDKEAVKNWGPFFAWLDQAGPRFVATLPAQETQVEVAEVFGVILDVSPYVTAFEHKDAKSLSATYRKSLKERALSFLS